MNYRKFQELVDSALEEMEDNERGEDMSFDDWMAELISEAKRMEDVL